MNGLENQNKDVKRIKDIKDRSISFKFSNFKHYFMKPTLISICICLVIIIVFVGSGITYMIYDSPMILLFIFIIFIFMIAALYSYFSNYYVVNFGDNYITVKSFFGKETVFELTNSIGIYIRTRNHYGKSRNIKTTELFIQDEDTKKVSTICIDVIKEELIEKFLNNFIYK